MAWLACHRADGAAGRGCGGRAGAGPPTAPGRCRRNAADRGAVHLELGVVPWRSGSEALVELDRLGVAEVAGVVVAAVAEVDPAHERDVVVGTVVAPDHEQLLVVAARRGVRARRAGSRRRPRFTVLASA